MNNIVWLVPNVEDGTSYFYIISTVLYIVTVLGPLVNITVLMLISQLGQQSQMVPHVHLGAIVYGYMFV